MQTVILAVTGAHLLAHRNYLRRTPLLWVWLFAVIAAFSFLPMNIQEPVYWWGVNVRLAMIITVLLISIADRPLDGTPVRWARISTFVGGAAASVYIVSIAIMLGRFNSNTMKGFDDILQVAVKNVNTCSIYHPSPFLREFPGDPLWYASNLVLAKIPVPTDANLFGNPGVPIAAGPKPAPAFMGRLEAFDWNMHPRWCHQLLLGAPASSELEAKLSSSGYEFERHGHWYLGRKQ
ncbi:MAG: hypothetical protein HC923_11120 [Myxococcales bacterium]|nr:hypothetical protein [Myxococcales bacterium]